MKTGGKSNRKSVFTKRAVAALLCALMVVSLFPEVTMAETGKTSSPVVMALASETQSLAATATPTPDSSLPSDTGALETPTPAPAMLLPDDSAKGSPTPTPSDEAGDGDVVEDSGSVKAMGVMLMGAPLSLASECALTIRFNGVSISGGTVRDAANRAVATIGSASDAVTVNVPTGSNYRVLLQQGNSTQTVATGVDCTGESASIDDIVCTLTANYPGVTLSEARVRDAGNNLISQKTGTFADAINLTILRGANYRVELKQGNSQQVSSGIDCTGATATLSNLVCALGVQFPGVTISEARVRDAGNNLISQQTGTFADAINFTILRGANYRVELRQGNSQQVSSGIDCTGGTANLDNLVCALGIQFPGVTISEARVRDAGNNLISQQTGTLADAAAFTILRGANYRVELRQGNSQQVSSGIDCTGETASLSNLVCALTLNFPGVTVTEARVRDAGNNLISQQTGSFADTVRFTVLRGVNYRTELRQGNSQQTTTLIDASAAAANVDHLSGKITIQFPGLTVDSVTIRDAANNMIVDKRPATDSATFDVLSGSNYSATLVAGGASYRFSNITVAGGAVVLLDKSSLTVNYPGVGQINSIDVLKNGTRVASASWTSETSSFNLLPGRYDIRLTKGAMVYEFKNVLVLGQVTLNTPVLDLVVNFPGVSTVNSIALNQGGKPVATNSWKDNTTSFAVFDNGIDYSVTVVKGGMSYTGTPVRSGTNRLELNVPVVELAVNFPGVTTVNSIALSQGGKAVAANSWKDNTTSFVVFDNGSDYSVTVDKGGMSYTGTPTRAGDPARLELNVPVLDLVVNFPGVATVNSIALSQGGKAVATNSWKDNSTTFRVFDNGSDYALTVTKGGMTYTGTATRASDPERLELNIPVLDLVVNFPGVTTVNSIALNQGGKPVATNSWKDNTTAFKVFDNGSDYSITVVKGGMSYTGTPARMSDPDRLELNVPITHLSIKYPGAKNVTPVTVSQSGVSIVTNTWTNDATEFYLFQSETPYQVSLTSAGKTYTYASVNCNTANLTLDKTGLVLNTGGLTPDVVQLKQNGVLKYTFYYVAPGTKLSVLNGYYDITLQRGGMQTQLSHVLCLGDPMELMIGVKTLTVNYPGVTSVDTVTISQGGTSVARKDWTNETASFVVFDNGLDYDIVVKKGGMTYSGTVPCANPVLNVPVIELVANYPGAASVDTVTVSQNGAQVWRRDWTSESSTYKVFDNGGSYDVSVKKGGMTYQGTAQRKSEPARYVFDVPMITLSVNYPGVTSVDTVTVTQNGTQIWRRDWTSESTSFAVFDNGADYAVSLRKGGMSYSGSVTCEEPVLNVPVLDLVVNYPGVTSVDTITVSQNASQVWRRDWTSNSTTFKVFDNGGTYQVAANKSSMAYSGTAERRTEPDRYVLDIPVTNLKVKYPGITSVTTVKVLSGGSTIYNKDWTSDETEFFLFQTATPYQVTLAHKGITYSYANVMADAAAVTLDQSSVVLNTGGITLDQVQFVQGSTVKYTFYNVTSGQSLKVLNGVYDILVQKGAMQSRLNGVICLGDETAAVVATKTLTVNFPGITANAVQIRQSGSTVFEQYNMKDTAQFTVLDNGLSYEAYAAKGAMSATGTGLAGSTITLGVKSITVNFPGISANVVQLRQSGSTVLEVYNQTGTTQFTVFDNGTSYEAVASKGKMSASGTGLAGSTIDLGVKTITVNFPGITANVVQMRQSGSTVLEVYNQTDTTQFTVFDNGTLYEAYAAKGAMSATGTGLAGGTIDLGVKTLTVVFTGITANVVQLRQSGSTVFEQYNMKDTAQFVVFDNGIAYEAYAQKGGMSISQSGTGDTIVLPTMTLTVNFPGVTATNVRLNQNSAGIYENYNLVNRAQFLVFDNGLPYEAIVTYNAGVRKFPLTRQKPTASFPVAQEEDNDNNALEEDAITNDTPTTIQTAQAGSQGAIVNQVQSIVENPIPLAGSPLTQNNADEPKSAVSQTWLLLGLIPAGALVWFIIILVMRRRKEEEAAGAAR